MGLECAVVLSNSLQYHSSEEQNLDLMWCWRTDEHLNSKISVYNQTAMSK